MFSSLFLKRRRFELTELGEHGKGGEKGVPMKEKEIEEKITILRVIEWKKLRKRVRKEKQKRRNSTIVG